MLQRLSTKFLGLMARAADVPATRVDRVRLYTIERILHHKCIRRKTIQPVATWPAPAEFIVRNMGRAITTRGYVVAWLLCVVLTGLAIHSPHCDRCDGPDFFTSSLAQQPLADHPRPSVPDNCNGICWCCGFHWLPNASPVLTLANKVTIGVWPEPVSPVLAPRSPIFRPPRTAISS